MTNSAINTNNPIAISSGGTGSSSYANTNGVIYYNGTQLSATSAGTAGQVFLSNGPSSAPSFQNVSGSGEWILLETLSASNSSSLVFSSGISSTYTTYALILKNLNTPGSGTSTYLTMRMSTNGGSSYITSYTGGAITWVNSIVGTHASAATTSILLGDLNASTPNSGTTSGYCGTLYLYNLAANVSGIYPSVVGTTQYPQNGTAISTTYSQIFCATTSSSLSVNALQLAYSGSNAIMNGTASLYALVQ